MSIKTIQLKRSNVNDSIPTAEQLVEGEIALNIATNNEKLFLKNSNNKVVTLISRAEINELKTLLQNVLTRLITLENADKIDILTSTEYENLINKNDNTLYIIK